MFAYNWTELSVNSANVQSLPKFGSVSETKFGCTTAVPPSPPCTAKKSSLSSVTKYTRAPYMRGTTTSVEPFTGIAGSSPSGSGTGPLAAG